MSSDYYFKKWKQTLVDLEALVNLDVHFQDTKVHDKSLCEATRRMSGILSRYMVAYNETWECLHHNLQMQKSSYMHAVLTAVVARILELKHELQKLEHSEFHFACNGLIDHILIPDNTQLAEIPDIHERAEGTRHMLADIFEQVKQKKRTLEEETAKREALEEEAESNWWDTDAPKKEEVYEADENKVEITSKQAERKRMIEIIQAQEKSRKVIQGKIRKHNKRAKWEKELAGTLKPPASYEVRERAANLIQQVCREYFTQKRQKLKQSKRNELLGIKLRWKPKTDQKQQFEQIFKRRVELKRKYIEQWKIEYQKMKEEYIKNHSEEIQDYREFIREWFRKWYESIKFFHDIPPIKRGGATLIINEELPSPQEWQEQYDAYLVKQKSNKGQSAMDKKFTKEKSKREATELKRAEHMKNKHEEGFRRKLMKNPTMHPGFTFPVSKKTGNILQVIRNYYRDWADLDEKETFDVKEKHVLSVDMANIYMEAKSELVANVEDDMRNELKLLKKALKLDYEERGEQMPELMKQPYKKAKKVKKKKVQKTTSVNIAEKLEDLVFRGYVKEYPKTKIAEFIGDPNFGGDELRCQFAPASPHNGELRFNWWEKCRKVSHGLNRILLVGPRGSGKTMLTHILATMNDAVLFELDPRQIQGFFESSAYLNHLVRSVASCARAVQPAVIHVKNVQRLFYRKVPPHHADVDWELIQRYFTKKLFKYIHKTDKVTVVGSCIDPWLARSAQLVKLFPTVVLMPGGSHGTAAQLINDWVLRHTVIPSDFDVTCLAHVLKRYSFGYLQSALEKFLTAETRARIAARGLSPKEVYEFILSDGTAQEIEYDKYVQWYSTKTAWGRTEKKHMQEQLEFKHALAVYEEKMAKKKNKPQQLLK